MKGGFSVDDDTRLDAVLRAVAAGEGAQLEGHPEPDELLDYHLGVLGEEETERVRDHLALCPSCTSAVLDFAAFPDLETPAGASPLSEHELARQRRRLEEASAALEAEEGNAAPRRSWAAVWGWGVAAMFCATTVGLLVGRPEVREVPPAPARADVISASLRAEGGEPIRGAAPSRIKVPRWAGQVSLRLEWDELATLPRYRLELEGPEGRMIWEDPDVHRGPDGDFHVALERELLGPGRHTLQLLAGERGEEVLATFPFQVILE